MLVEATKRQNVSRQDFLKSSIDMQKLAVNCQSTNCVVKLQKFGNHISLYFLSQKKNNIEEVQQAAKDELPYTYKGMFISFF